LETTDVVSKFWADPNEMEKDANDNGKEIVCTKRKPKRPPKGTGKSKKLLRKFSIQLRNEGLFIFLEC